MCVCVCVVRIRTYVCACMLTRGQFSDLPFHLIMLSVKNLCMTFVQRDGIVLWPSLLSRARVRFTIFRDVGIDELDVISLIVLTP